VACSRSSAWRENVAPIWTRKPLGRGQIDVVVVVWEYVGAVGQR
jgi:hypothetical protein